MLKIGTKVYFTKYIPKNLVTGKAMTRKFGDRKKYPRGVCLIERYGDPDKGTYNVDVRIVTSKEKIEGAYVGSFRKKLSRKYRLVLNSAPSNNPFEVNGLEPRFSRRRIIYRDDRYTTNPRRLDNPRELTSCAIVKVGRLLVGVPMDNIYAESFGNKTTLI